MLIFENTHQCVVKEAELRPFSTWPCPCLSCVPLTGRKRIYITDELKSSLQSWIIRLKSSCNLSNRLYFLLVYNSVFHNVFCVNHKTWAERSAPCWCTWTCTSLLHGCRPKSEQRGLSESLSPTYTLLSNRPFTFLVYFHRWAKGKKGFKPAQISRWFSDLVLWL